MGNFKIEINISALLIFADYVQKIQNIQIGQTGIYSLGPRTDDIFANDNLILNIFHTKTKCNVDRYAFLTAVACIVVVNIKIKNDISKCERHNRADGQYIYMKKNF